ncbi:hypothetical protein BDZ97DRAFT_1762664 [Flammula alnicola]|nr:hypothetical protein BDZ97DRAFT_1762664 [Flammula alnicola]
MRSNGPHPSKFKVGELGPLTSVLGTNYIPTDQETNKTKEFILEHFAKLAEVDEEITQIQATLNEKFETRKPLSIASCVSPSTGCLMTSCKAQAIFQKGLHTEVSQCRMRWNRALLLLGTLVCHHCRQLAHVTSIHILISKKDAYEGLAA